MNCAGTNVKWNVLATIRRVMLSLLESSMTKNSLWRGVVIVVLCAALARPAQASGYPNANAIGAGIVAVAAAVGTVAVILVVHYSKKRAITGCVNSAGSEMTVTDEKDKQAYTLSGATAGIKPSERLKLQGKKAKSKGADKTLVWEVNAVTKDLGVCQPSSVISARTPVPFPVGAF